MRVPATLEPLPLSPGAFARLRAAIHRDIGIDLGPGKLTMLRARLQMRARALGLRSIDEYGAMLLDTERGRSEWTAFVDAVTTNKTAFFREPFHFEYLLRDVLTEDVRRAHRSGNPFRAWCAACSTGEEPYTLAMCLATVTEPSFAYGILATDISARVLQAAQVGIYGDSQIAGIPDDVRRQFLRRGFGQQQGRYRVATEVRRHVQFAQMNLLHIEQSLRAKFEAIFLRNVLIYFDQNTRRSVVRAVAACLRPGGHLFLGHAEAVSGDDAGLVAVAPSVLVRR